MSAPHTRLPEARPPAVGETRPGGSARLRTVGGRVMLAAALLAALACDDGPTGLEPGETFVQTDRLVYTLTIAGEPGSLSATVDIPFRIENRTTRTWFLQSCNVPHVELQKREADATWRTVFTYWDPLSSFCEVIEVTPGGSYEHTLALRAGLPGEAVLPTLDNADPGGVYRLRVESLLEAGNGSEPLPESRRVSNSFELRVEQIVGRGAAASGR